MTSLDVRLVPVAAALWLGAAVGLHTGIAWSLAAGCAVVLLAAFIIGQRFRIALVWLAAVALGLLLAALRVDAASPANIAEAIADAGVVRFEAVIDAEPRELKRRGFGGLTVEPVMVARATLVTITLDHVEWHSSLPVTLQWNPDGRRHAVGERVRGTAIPRPADVATRSAYWIRVQGRLQLAARETRGAWFASRIRDGLAHVTRGASGGEGASLLPGLVLGDTRAQSAQLVEDMQVSGLSHLTAVSGANVAIVIGAVMWLLRRTRIRARHRHVMLLLCIAAFVVVVQPQPSVVRAAMMGGISVFALATGARRASASSLWLSIVALLVIDPFLAWQWGFALSVAATGGLILLGPSLTRACGNRRWSPALAITVSAQLATFPVLLAMGRPPTWLSIPANLICEPLVAPATVSGFLAAVFAAIAIIPVDSVSTVALAIAAVVAWPGIRLADVIAWIAHRGVQTPLAVAPIPSLGALVLVLTIVFVLFRLGLRRRGFAALFALALVLSVGLPDGLHRWPQANWWYVMCDVGQGDATVFNLGTGVMVIDAGPEPTAVRRCLRQLGVRKVEVLILTHFHADHVEGLNGVLQQAHVQHVYSTPIHEPGVEWQRVCALLGREPRTLQAGDVLAIGATRVRVLWPVVEEASGDPNNASLVLDVERDGIHALVTGDADPAAQEAIELPMSGYAVLKVPHHASRYQDPTFVQRVAPGLALISVGRDNDYGHPAASTVAAYRTQGIRVLRTDLVGSIAVSVSAGRLSYAAMSD